jgi:hypothetical protein
MYIHTHISTHTITYRQQNIEALQVLNRRKENVGQGEVLFPELSKFTEGSVDQRKQFQENSCVVNVRGQERCLPETEKQRYIDI